MWKAGKTAGHTQRSYPQKLWVGCGQAVQNQRENQL
jgi:hypothetical protein